MKDINETIGVQMKIADSDSYVRSVHMSIEVQASVCNSDASMYICL